MNSPPDVCDTREESPRMWKKIREDFSFPKKEFLSIKWFIYNIFICTHFRSLGQLDKGANTSIATILKGPTESVKATQTRVVLYQRMVLKSMVLLSLEKFCS